MGYKSNLVTTFTHIMYKKKLEIRRSNPTPAHNILDSYQLNYTYKM